MTVPPACKTSKDDVASFLFDLEPKPLWKHFDALTRIPRPSKKEGRAREYVISQAGRLGLEVVEDKPGNLIIRKPAHSGREQAPMSLLQAHLDMVCEKDEGTDHNFEIDPIKVIRDGDWVKAVGTTLGADNGVGVAAALAVMESKNIAHGPLEFVFTVDEETGLTGATGFRAGLLKSQYFLNLDTEEIGTLCIGCAGGLNTIARRKITRQRASGNKAYRIKVSGLKGGHSGVDIHQGRGNAVRILGNVLQAALSKLPLEIAEIKGGNAHNAIPREASAIVVLDGKHSSLLKRLITAAESQFKADQGSFDPGLRITVEAVKAPEKVMRAKDAQSVVELMVAIPHGVLAMSPDIPGLVQNSTNFATIATNGNTVEILTSQRSAIDGSRRAAANMVATVCRLAGFEVEHTGSYPGWKPQPDNELVRKAQAVHEKVFGKPASLIAMHAGLECGVIGEKYPGMQMVSFGPTIIDVHSPNERVQISTVESFWHYLTALLENI
jgi:dipeptidase D